MIAEANFVLGQVFSDIKLIKAPDKTMKRRNRNRRVKFATLLPVGDVLII